MSVVLSEWILLILKPTLDKHFVNLCGYFSYFEIASEFLLGLYAVCLLDYLNGGRQLIK